MDFGWKILNWESTRTTYIDWQRIQWFAALCGRLCTGWAYFYHRDHFSLNNLRRSSMAAGQAHILGCSDCYIRSILLLNLIYLFHGPKKLISFFCYFTGMTFLNWSKIVSKTEIKLYEIIMWLEHANYRNVSVFFMQNTN